MAGTLRGPDLRSSSDPDSGGQLYRPAGRIAGRDFLPGRTPLLYPGEMATAEIHYSLAWISGAAAMLWKEMSVTFPLAVIL